MDGVGPKEALFAGLELSEHCCVMVVDGIPGAIYGVAPVEELGLARPWFLTSGSPLLHKSEFMGISVDTVNFWKTKYPYMENFVDKENLVAVAWLGQLGFKVEKEPVRIGVLNELFHRFYWRDHV